MLEVGRIIKPHGIKGEVIVELVTNRPQDRLAPGVELQSDHGAMEVVAASPHQGRWIVAFAGVATRNDAELLRGTVLRAEPLEGEDDVLWVHEMVGSELFDSAGHRHGTVEAVEANPASDLLVLDTGRLVPLTFVVAGQSRPGRIVVDAPPGLLDDDSETA